MILINQKNLWLNNLKGMQHIAICMVQKKALPSFVFEAHSSVS